MLAKAEAFGRAWIAGVFDGRTWDPLRRLALRIVQLCGKVPRQQLIDAIDRMLGDAAEPRGGPGHHGSVWLGAPLGALVEWRGITVRRLPAAYIRAYVKRNKTDVADAAALLEAARCADITPVQIKSVEQQALQGLHRIRSLWMATRTSRINALPGFCREFGIPIAAGSRTGVENITRVLADPNAAVPELIRGTMQLLIEEIRLLEVRITQLERELTQVAKGSAACKLLLSIPGVGLLTATAMVAATSGTVTHIKDARHFASWFGLTPKEYSFGSTRQLGRISKKGDRYLRMLLTHGAHSVLRSAVVAQARGQLPQGVRAWALAVQARANHNKAACALASKMARICHAVMRDGQPFGQAADRPAPRLAKKSNRQAFAMAA